jgi:Ca2+-transporting ATPase
VAEARRFSLRLPLIGSVRVPPPDQLAFFGVLGGLVVLELIDWPVAVAIGIGSAVVSRQLSDAGPPSTSQDDTETT